MARRPRRSRRRSERSYGAIAAGALLLVAALTIGGGFGYLWLTSPKPAKLDAATLCPIDGGVSTTVVLIDATDELPAVGKQQVEIRLADIARDLPKSGRLELRVMAPDAPGGRVIFDKCNPGDGSELNELSANPEMARRRWLAGFDEPLRSVLSNGLVGARADQSAIMEAVQQIAVERFSSKADASKPKQIVIVSDMIENTPSYSQYKGSLDYQRFVSSSAYRQFRTDLGGAEVDILYIQRKKPSIDTLKHMEFWREWAVDNRGRIGSIERLQGAN